MVTTTTVHRCRHCGSERLKKNGRTECGAQRVRCLECKRTAVLERRPARYDDRRREQTVAAASRERLSGRAIIRTFGPCYRTLRRWAQKKADALPALEDTLLAGAKGDVLELDELWGFVTRKAHALWLVSWRCAGAPSRLSPTRSGTARPTPPSWLRASIPAAYRRRATRSDFWSAYAEAFSRRTHRLCAKQEGQTCRVENLNGRLRQRAVRFVRRTLSFSKCEEAHELFTRLWLTEHNLEMRRQHAG